MVCVVCVAGVSRLGLILRFGFTVNSLKSLSLMGRYLISDEISFQHFVHSEHPCGEVLFRLYTSYLSYQLQRSLLHKDCNLSSLSVELQNVLCGKDNHFRLTRVFLRILLYSYRKVVLSLLQQSNQGNLWFVHSNSSSNL